MADTSYFADIPTVLWLAFAVLAAYGLSLSFKPYSVSPIAKASGIVLLALAAWQVGGPPSAMLIAGLAFSATGDVFLDVDRFKTGLVSFLIAQVIYGLIFLDVIQTSGMREGLFVVLAILPVLLALTMLAWLWPDLGEMKIPVTAYIAAITFMGVSAVLAPFGSGLVAIGAICFIVSDSLIAVQLFKDDFRGANHAIWATYAIAQSLIVLGVLYR